MTPRRAASGFSLIELLVALAVFATMAALAYGGLDALTRTRAELARQEDAFRDLVRAVAALDRDLGAAVARPVLGGGGQTLPALLGSADRIEFTRLGFANPQAEARSNLERVFYAFDAGTLRRGRYAVLDRAPDTVPELVDLAVPTAEFRLRYLAPDNRWLPAWPPQGADPAALPRAVEWRWQTRAHGEIGGTVELVAAWPAAAAGAGP
jgi:general secretion pathway protein J